MGGLALPVASWAVLAAVAAAGAWALRDGLPRAGRRPDLSRLAAGVPWGTLAVCALVVGVYAGLQRGFAWRQPLVVPFTSWSYAHPVGVAVSPFAHASTNHLVDNVTGLLVFGALAEAAVGHGAAGSRRRRVAGFVAALLVGGVATSAFAWGPTVGSSSLVFALAGFAAVWYPGAAVAAFVVREALEAVVDAVRDPVVTAVSAAGGGQPWWVDVAVQGHAFGLLLGVAAGAALARRRDAPVDARATAAAVWVVAAAGSFWAVWWPTGGGFTLYRGAGVAVLALGAPAVGVAARRFAAGDDSGRPAAALAAPLVAMAAVAVAVNAPAAAPVPDGADPVAVGGYQVGYAEDVPDRRFDAPGLGTAATTSGVVVVDADRGVWTTAVTADALARRGTARVHLGGVGWTRTVFAVRDGWRVAGGGRAYRVSLHPRDGFVHRAYVSGPARASPVVGGFRVAVVPRADHSRLRVVANDTVVGAARVPGYGQTVAVAGLRVRRVDDRLVAVHGATRVTVAWRE